MVTLIEVRSVIGHIVTSSTDNFRIAVPKGLHRNVNVCFRVLARSRRAGACISTNPSTSLTARLATRPSDKSAKLYSHLQSKAHRSANRKRVVRFGLLAANFAVVAVVATLVVRSPHTSGGVKASAAEASPTTATAGPLDQVSSTDIALTVARMGSMPESTAINNQAQSQAVSTAVATSSTTGTITAKPQVVATTLKSSADITSYTATAGDTVNNLSQKFGVTSDSIRWSNNITGDALTAGTKLTIPPVNGIVYTVKPGDTVDTLAQKFNASKDKITAFNDAEIKGLQPGSQVVIPDGTQATPMTAAQVAHGTASTSASASFPWGGAPIYGYNGYDYGYCTWYVANRLPVPSNWGNANTWDNLAPASGWTVSTTPRAGAVAQSDAGSLGHVAYVEAVSDDGTMIKYSDMNGLAGFGHVGYSGWAPATHFQHYIYR